MALYLFDGKKCISSKIKNNNMKIKKKKGFEHGNIYWNRIDVIWIKQPLFALATNSGVGMCVCGGLGGSGYYPLLIILEMIFVVLL